MSRPNSHHPNSATASPSIRHHPMPSGITSTNRSDGNNNTSSQRKHFPLDPDPLSPSRPLYNLDLHDHTTQFVRVSRPPYPVSSPSPPQPHRQNSPQQSSGTKRRRSASTSPVHSQGFSAAATPSSSALKVQLGQRGTAKTSTTRTASPVMVKIVKRPSSVPSPQHQTTTANRPAWVSILPTKEQEEEDVVTTVPPSSLHFQGGNNGTGMEGVRGIGFSPQQKAVHHQYMSTPNDSSSFISNGNHSIYHTTQPTQQMHYHYHDRSQDKVFRQAVERYHQRHEAELRRPMDEQGARGGSKLVNSIGGERENRSNAASVLRRPQEVTNVSLVSDTTTASNDDDGGGVVSSSCNSSGIVSTTKRIFHGTSLSLSEARKLRKEEIQKQRDKQEQQKNKMEEEENGERNNAYEKRETPKISLSSSSSSSFVFSAMIHRPLHRSEELLLEGSKKSSSAVMGERMGGGRDFEQWGMILKERMKAEKEVLLSVEEDRRNHVVIGRNLQLSHMRMQYKLSYTAMWHAATQREHENSAKLRMQLGQWEDARDQWKLALYNFQHCEEYERGLLEEQEVRGALTLLQVHSCVRQALYPKALYDEEFACRNMLFRQYVDFQFSILQHEYEMAEGEVQRNSQYLHFVQDMLEDLEQTETRARSLMCLHEQEGFSFLENRKQQGIAGLQMMRAAETAIRSTISLRSFRVVSEEENTEREEIILVEKRRRAEMIQTEGEVFHIRRNISRQADRLSVEEQYHRQIIEENEAELRRERNNRMEMIVDEFGGGCKAIRSPPQKNLLLLQNVSSETTSPHPGNSVIIPQQQREQNVMDNEEEEDVISSIRADTPKSSPKKGGTRSTNPLRDKNSKFPSPKTVSTDEERSPSPNNRTPSPAKVGGDQKMKKRNKWTPTRFLVDSAEKSYLRPTEASVAKIRSPSPPGRGGTPEKNLLFSPPQEMFASTLEQHTPTPKPPQRYPDYQHRHRSPSQEQSRSRSRRREGDMARIFNKKSKKRNENYSGDSDSDATPNPNARTADPDSIKNRPTKLEFVARSATPVLHKKNLEEAEEKSKSREEKTSSTSPEKRWTTNPRNSNRSSPISSQKKAMKNVESIDRSTTPHHQLQLASKHEPVVIKMLGTLSPARNKSTLATNRRSPKRRSQEDEKEDRDLTHEKQNHQHEANNYIVPKQLLQETESSVRKRRPSPTAQDPQWRKKFADPTPLEFNSKSAQEQLFSTTTTTSKQKEAFVVGMKTTSDKHAEGNMMMATDAQANPSSQTKSNTELDVIFGRLSRPKGGGGKETLRKENEKVNVRRDAGMVSPIRLENILRADDGNHKEYDISKNKRKSTPPAPTRRNRSAEPKIVHHFHPVRWNASTRRAASLDQQERQGEGEQRQYKSNKNASFSISSSFQVGGNYYSNDDGHHGSDDEQQQQKYTLDTHQEVRGGDGARSQSPSSSLRHSVHYNPTAFQRLFETTTQQSSSRQRSPSPAGHHPSTFKYSLRSSSGPGERNNNKNENKKKRWSGSQKVEKSRQDKFDEESFQQGRRRRKKGEFGDDSTQHSVTIIPTTEPQAEEEEEERITNHRSQQKQKVQNKTTTSREATAKKTISNPNWRKDDSVRAPPKHLGEYLPMDHEEWVPSSYVDTFIRRPQPAALSTNKHNAQLLLPPDSYNRSERKTTKPMQTTTTDTAMNKQLTTKKEGEGILKKRPQRGKIDSFVSQGEEEEEDDDVTLSSISTSRESSAAAQLLTTAMTMTGDQEGNNNKHLHQHRQQKGEVEEAELEVEHNHPKKATQTPSSMSTLQAAQSQQAMEDEEDEEGGEKEERFDNQAAEKSKPEKEGETIERKKGGSRRTKKSRNIFLSPLEYEEEEARQIIKRFEQDYRNIFLREFDETFPPPPALQFFENFDLEKRKLQQKQTPSSRFFAEKKKISPKTKWEQEREKGEIGRGGSKGISQQEMRHHHFKNKAEPIEKRSEEWVQQMKQMYTELNMDRLASSALCSKQRGNKKEKSSK